MIKLMIKAVIIELCEVFELTPAEVVKGFLQAFTAVIIGFVSIRPACWLVVYIGECLGRC